LNTVGNDIAGFGERLDGTGGSDHKDHNRLRAER
jgi:hypothetical protein